MSIKVAGAPGSVDGDEEGDDFVDAGGDEGEGDEGDEEGLLEGEEGSNEEDVSMHWFGEREKRKCLFQVYVKMRSDRTAR